MSAATEWCRERAWRTIPRIQDNGDLRKVVCCDGNRQNRSLGAPVAGKRQKMVGALAATS